jgi:hypothetical protein
MQDEEIITEESLTGGEQNVPPAVSEPAVSVEALTLDELNAFTGKNFPTKESALKSIKDTYKAVVQRPQVPQSVPQIDPNQYVSRSEFEQASFYANNPDYKTHSELISALAAQSGKPLHEVVQMDSFKTVFEKVKAADAIEQSKSVLHTNPRLGHVTDKITQAREAIKSGDVHTARTSAVSAVLGAYES